MSKKTIHSFARGPYEEVRLCAGEYRERVYLDLRIYFKNEEMEDWRPTKKGITLPLESLGELRNGIQKLEMSFQSRAASGASVSPSG